MKEINKTVEDEAGKGKERHGMGTKVAGDRVIGHQGNKKETKKEGALMIVSDKGPMRETPKAGEEGQGHREERGGRSIVMRKKNRLGNVTLTCSLLCRSVLKIASSVKSENYYHYCHPVALLPIFITELI